MSNHFDNYSTRVRYTRSSLFKGEHLFTCAEIISWATRYVGLKSIYLHKAVFERLYLDVCLRSLLTPIIRRRNLLLQAGLLVATRGETVDPACKSAFA